MTEPKNISDVLSIARRRKWSLIIPTVLGVAITVIVVFSLDPMYQSTSTILIEEQEIPRDFVMSTVTSFAEQRIQSINQRIMSTTKLLEIINRFSLYADKREKWTQEEIVSRMREKDIKLESISADVRDRRTGNAMRATIAFSLSFRGERPAVVQQVASVLASLYLEENLRIRKEQVTGTARFLEEEMKEVNAQLAKNETKLTPFKTKYINELPEHLPINIQSLERIERDADRVRSDLRVAKEREDYLQAQVEFFKAQLEVQQPRKESAKPDPIEEADKALLNQMKAKLITLQSKFSDQYPDVIRAKIEIEELEKKVASAAVNKEEEVEREPSKVEDKRSDHHSIVTLSSQLAATKSEIESFKKELENLSLKRDAYQQRIETTPRVEETYRSLMMERHNLQTKYDDLMKKSLEAKVSQGLEKEQMGERFTLIDPARFPEKPVSPNIPAIFFVGLILSIGSGLGTAALKEFSDQSVRTMEELGAWTQIPVLGGIPYLVTRKDRRRKQIKRVVIGVVILTGLAAAPLVFHLFIMDLDIFWAKLMRLMAKYM